MTLMQYRGLLAERQAAASRGYDPERVGPLPATAPDGSPAKDLPLPAPLLCGCAGYEVR